MKRLWFLIPLAAFLALAVILAVGLKRDPREVPSPLIDKPAPKFALARLDDATKTITTSFPPDRLEEMLALGRTIDDANITKKVLGPPYALRDMSAADYRLVIVPTKIAALSIALFGNDSRYATATGAVTP